MGDQKLTSQAKEDNERLGPILLQNSRASRVIAASWELHRPRLAANSVGSGGAALIETSDATGQSHSTPGRYALWWWATDQLAEAPQILGDGRQRELKLGAAWTSQPEPAEP